MWLVAGMSLGLGLVACGGSAPTQTPNAMFHSYVESTTVINDRYRGSNGDDRMAEFAAEGTPSDIMSAMFSAYSCDGSAGANTDFTTKPACPPNASVSAAARQVGGPVHEREILIQHQGGQLELMPLYLVTDAAGATELIDTSGQTYTGGMADFRDNNSLLTSDDRILVPDNVTSTSGTFNLVVLSGRTGGVSPWLVVGGVVVVVLAALGLIFALVRRRRQHDDSALATP